MPRTGSSWTITRLLHLPCVSSVGEAGYRDWIATHERGARFDLSCRHRFSHNQTAYYACLDNYFMAARPRAVLDAAESKEVWTLNSTNPNGTPNWIGNMGLTDLVASKVSECESPHWSLGGKVWAPHMIEDHVGLPGDIEYLRTRQVRVILLQRSQLLEEVVSLMFYMQRSGRCGKESGIKCMHCIGEDCDPTRRGDTLRLHVADTVQQIIRWRNSNTKARAAFGVPDDATAGKVFTTRGFPVLYLLYEELRAHEGLWQELAVRMNRPTLPGLLNHRPGNRRIYREASMAHSSVRSSKQGNGRDSDLSSRSQITKTWQLR